MMKILVLLLCWLVRAGDMHNILVFPYAHCLNSHLYNMEKLVSLLLMAGHDVTMVVHSNYGGPIEEHHSVSGSLRLVQYTPPEEHSLLCQSHTFQTYIETPMHVFARSFFNLTLEHCKRLFRDEALMADLSSAHFDLGLYDYVDPCSRILADHMEIPFITLHSHGIDTLMPRNPSYLPHLASSYSASMTYSERVINTLIYSISRLVGFRIIDAIENTKAELGLNMTKSSSTVLDRASVKLVLGDFALDYTSYMEPSSLVIGGFIQPPHTDLAGEFEDILSSSPNGVVLLNMGTFISFYEPYWRELFAKAVANLPYTVLWKYSGETPKSLGSNTHLLRWMPNFQLLADPRIKVLITHGGMNSVFEAGYHGVPSVVIPLTNDQPFQAEKIVHAGMGISLDIQRTNPDQIEQAVRRVASEKKFKNNANRISYIMKNKPISQHDEINYWVNFVGEQGNANHLHSLDANYSWYQVYCLDIIALYLIIVYVTVRLLTSMMKSTMRLFMKTPKQVLPATKSQKFNSL